MKQTRLILVNFRLIALPIIALAASSWAMDPITGTWRFWNNSVREMRSDGSSGPPGHPGDSSWSRLSPSSAAEPAYQISYGGGKATDRLTLRGGGTQLWGMMNARKPFLTATRIAESPPSQVATAKPGNAAPRQSQPKAAQNPPPNSGRQMVFAPDWLPAPQDISREFSRSLDFYCRFAVGDAPRGGEPAPRTIIWNLEWLMPMADAEARVPGVQRLQRDYDMINPGFPHHSIHIRSLYGKFVDPATLELFNICNLICDADKQLISVELVATNPKLVFWLPPTMAPDKSPKALPAVGTRDPYYDFIEVKHNGSTSQHVSYQITSAAPGVTVIQTILARNVGSVLENVRWYLPAPFAGKLLEMVEKIGK